MKKATQNIEESLTSSEKTAVDFLRAYGSVFKVSSANDYECAYTHLVSTFDNANKKNKKLLAKKIKQNDAIVVMPDGTE